MKALVSFLALVALAVLVVIAARVMNLQFLLAVVMPYTAFTVFVSGVVYRVLKWARAPVPFRIPSTCGQQKSLPWIKASPLDNPLAQN